MPPSRARRQTNTQRPNTCCFCWCCCCSCSCTKPTLDEISVWAQSFDKLMKNPAGRNVFREFLRTEYSEENMLFWLACEDLKQEMNKNTVEEKARMIYEDYISILSPKEVRSALFLLFSPLSPLSIFSSKKVLFSPLT
nr:regulator of G-protein signaling 20-like [Oncorhynchus nerka]